MKHIDLNKLDHIFPGAYFDLAFGCAESGYDDKPVIMADWNKVPHHVFDRIEALGYSCEWSDEWTTCSECGKAVRTSPNSYDWQPSYIIMDECEILCLECADPVEYYESIENTPNKAASNEFTHRYDPEAYGYTKINTDSYLSSFHGQNDDPVFILDTLKIDDPEGRYIFTLDYTSQFEIGFSVYRKEV